jgi:hypothetical protein
MLPLSTNCRPPVEPCFVNHTLSSIKGHDYPPSKIDPFEHKLFEAWQESRSQYPLEQKLPQVSLPLDSTQALLMRHTHHLLTQVLYSKFLIEQ